AHVPALAALPAALHLRQPDGRQPPAPRSPALVQPGPAAGAAAADRGELPRGAGAPPRLRPAARGPDDGAGVAHSHDRSEARGSLPGADQPPEAPLARRALRGNDARGNVASDG